MKKTDRKRRFNLFDGFILLLVIAVAAAGLYYFKLRPAAGGKCDVYFTVELRDMPKGFTKKIQRGDEISDSIKGYYLGKVYEFSEEPDTHDVPDSALKQIVRAVVPDKYRVLITVKAEGTESDSEIKAGDVAVRVGSLMAVKGKGYAGEGYIINLWCEKGGA